MKVYIVLLWIMDDRGGASTDVVGVYSNCQAARDEVSRVRSAIRLDKGERIIVRVVKHEVKDSLKPLTYAELARISASKWE